MRGPFVRALALTVVGVGASAIVVGSLGLLFDWGASSHAGTASTTAAARPTASATFPATTAPHTSPPAEQPAAFLSEFTAALRGADANFLFDRLDPAVIARYGAAECHKAVPGLFDSTVMLRLLSVSGPAPFTYASGGKTLAVPGVYTFSVGKINGTAAVKRDYHFALVNGKFRTFMDCGTPLPGAP